MITQNTTVNEIIAERDRLNSVIELLQISQPTATEVKRRGRPPASAKMMAVVKTATVGGGRSEASRLQQGEKMRAAWAKKKEAAALAVGTEPAAAAE